MRQAPNLVIACFCVGLFLTFFSAWALVSWGVFVRHNASTPILFSALATIGFFVVLVMPSLYGAVLSCFPRVVEISLPESVCRLRQIPFLQRCIDFDQVESIQLLLSRNGEAGWLCIKRKRKRAPVVIVSGGHLTEPYMTEKVLASIGKRICDAIKCAYERETVTKAVYFRLSWW